MVCRGTFKAIIELDCEVEFEDRLSLGQLHDLLEQQARRQLKAGKYPSVQIRNLSWEEKEE